MPAAPQANRNRGPLHSFPRPQASELSVVREPVSGTCPECGGTDLAAYRVLGDGGWWDVIKCQACLASIERTLAPRLGSLVPLGLTVGAAHRAR